MRTNTIFICVNCQKHYQKSESVFFKVFCSIKCSSYFVAKKYRQDYQYFRNCYFFGNVRKNKVRHHWRQKIGWNKMHILEDIKIY